MKIFFRQVDHLWARIVPAFDEMQIGGRLLWIFGLCCSIVALLVTLMIYSSLTCSCCEAEEKAGIALLGGTTLMSICSLSLSFFCVMVMLLGGHGEVFICRPLADSPNYTVLQRLLDKPGLLLTTQSQIGVINSILTRASHAKNATVTTSLGDVIENCGQNASTYATFQLETILEASQIANLDNYPTFTEAAERVVAREEDFFTLTASLGQILNIIISESHVNLTKYRMDLSQAIPERDLATFIDQMQRVSLQVIQLEMERYIDSPIFPHLMQFPKQFFLPILSGILIGYVGKLDDFYIKGISITFWKPKFNK